MSTLLELPGRLNLELLIRKGSTMSTNPTLKRGYHHYQAYLLRLWQDTPDSPLQVSLQATDSDERRIFANLETLLDFLRTQADVENPQRE